MPTDLTVDIDGVEVVIEAAPAAGYRESGLTERVAEGSQDLFDRGRAMLRALALTLHDDIAGFPEGKRPAEFHLQFGLKFVGETSVKIAKAGAEAQFVVNLVYRDPDQAPPPVR